MSPLPDSQVGKSVVGPRTFLTVREFLWYNWSAICGLSARWLYLGLMVTSSNRLMPQALWPRSPAPRAPVSVAGHRWPVPLQETLKHSSGSVSVGSLGPGACKVLFQPSEHLWWAWGLILNEISPLLSSSWGFSFARGCEVSFFGGIHHSPDDGCSALQFNHSVMSDYVQPHELQHNRPPCTSPTPRVYSNSCPLSLWCHPTISSSVVPFSSRLASLQASGSFPRSQFFASGGQSIGVSASSSGLPMNIKDWFSLGWTGWISLQSKGLSRVLQHHSSKASILQLSVFFIVQLSHPYMTTGKTIALTRWTFVDKVMSLLFNMLSSLVITFLTRSKCLLISWLQSPSKVILEPPKIKSVIVSVVSPSIFHEVMGPDAILSFPNVEF